MVHEDPNNHMLANATVRDLFAAHAPPMPDEWASLRHTEVLEHLAAEQKLRLLCEWRFVYADAMLAQRSE